MAVSLPNKLVAQVAFKAGGHVFHRLFTKNPGHLAKVTPAKIQSCDLQHGSFGTAGSIILWNYTLDGQAITAKHVIQDIDDEKKLVTLKWLEGEMLQLYKNVSVTFHVETKGGIEFVTSTIDYELISPENPHPISLLKFIIEFINEIEAHILG